MNQLQKWTKVEPRKEIAKFGPGDTVRVHVKIREGDKERLQAFEGTVIAKNHAGISETFTVRKISFGQGVERIFPMHSPSIERVDVVRHGTVRRSKLYYLRGLKGKAARIREEARSEKTERVPVASGE